MRGFIIAALSATFALGQTEEIVYDYDAHVAPILEEYCVSCHGPEKQKSKFRLDTFEHLMTPGSSDEEPIVPYVPMESPLLEYLLMPKSDEYAMPPEGEPSPSAEDILVIAQWIYHGATSSVAERAKLPLAERFDAEPLAAIFRLRDRGAIVQKISAKDSGLFVDLRGVSDGLTTQDLVDLAPIANWVEELNLSGQTVPASDAAWWAAFERLKILHLRQASVPEGHLVALTDLPALRRLNLAHAEVTTDMLGQLNVPQVEQLYISGITGNRRVLRALQTRHPNTKITDNWDLDEALAIQQNARYDSNKFDPGDPIILGEQISATGIKHSLLICGKFTGIISEENEVLWRGPSGSRDGMVLPNGNVLLSAQGEAREYLAGSQKIVWRYRLDERNAELGTVFQLPSGNTLVVERGVLPRLLEIDPEGKIAIEVPLQPETDNNHMQTRMARKLSNGNYLVPHLLAFKIKEYTPTGDVVNTIATDLPKLGGREARNWPFTAIRLPNGNTIANLTNGNKTVEFAPDGSVAWSVDNDDVDGRFADPCGGQRLPNGNTVICSYGQRDPSKTRIFEVNANKEVVWELFFPTSTAHQVHVLTTNGKPVSPILR
ncbi:MAG: hypothetical protein SynsKO_14320 [Synoicihabitans sp.]